MDLPCVLFALHREAMFFRRWFPPVRRLKGGPCPAAIHQVVRRQVLALVTGMGAEATRSALDWLCPPSIANERSQPSFVIAAGFCGALQPNLHVSDLIVPNAVLRDGRSWPACEVHVPLLEVPHRGPLLSVDAMVSDPQSKQRLGAMGAIAVDMESASVAQWCEEHGLPWMCLRVVSDDEATPVPEALARVLRGGRVSPGRLAAAILRRPTLVASLWRLGRDTRRAARSLAMGLGALFSVPESVPTAAP
jgi:adenosylhomocysteine nucleosidase